MAAVRIVHTSDLHLGSVWSSPFSEQDRAGRALQALVDLTKEVHADMLIVVGDVFDHNHVRPEVVLSAFQEFARAEVPVVLLPGNHDCLREESVYRRALSDMTAIAPNCTVLSNPAGESVSFPHLDLAVWGQPLLDYGSAQRPLAAIPPRGPELWQIAMAHGHYIGDNHDSSRSFLISRDELVATQRDYVALGHWEMFLPVMELPVPAVYSGAPLRMNAAALVELDAVQGVKVSQVTLRIP